MNISYIFDFCTGAINDRDSSGKSGNRIRGVTKDDQSERAFYIAASNKCPERHCYTRNEYFGR
ncbi:hypothetical protein VIBNISOn1_30147 [Vibrio nigripulchritudo SOn1]|uniref:Transposase n=1 Tax=Vibrio nigripulchritudo SOn1 TaxID=1238450 RepID=A0AAV2VSC1_9VIBR|nr:hypothetical protein VIBNISOn1_30147 [Vibrio nigripulchritudo SOn1]